jgi:hypothetical protein
MGFARNALLICALAAMPMSAWAMHPLITDDTETQGVGKYQLEMNAQCARDRATTAGLETKVREGEFEAILSYGVNDRTDIVVGLPLEREQIQTGGVTSREQGLSDLSVEAKWRFHEQDGFNVALKPGLTFPTGNDEKGRGAGKVGYSAFLIVANEARPWSIFFNLGYIRNENKESTVDERRDLWHVSLAAARDLSESVKLVGNIGVETNPDKGSHTKPAFLLGGLVFGVTDHVDVDLGLKAGLNDAEMDYTVLLGSAFRF